jgi:hypothetical protein
MSRHCKPSYRLNKRTISSYARASQIHCWLIFQLRLGSLANQLTFQPATVRLITYQQNAAQHAQDIFEHMRYSPYLPMVCEHFKNLQLSVAVLVPATPG